ncbi:Hemolysin, contains CBS domains [Ruminococcaceae bacterium FB2012]|nr:Hemolysin, contains CBS domains [Ruminococcaceae bacterium FB2012]
MTPLIIIVLLMISAVCSATETAFSSANRIRLKNMAASGSKRAAKALAMAEDFDKPLTAILIANNVVNIASSALATVFFTERFGSGSVGIATLVMTVLVLIFGEILPKSLAKENSERFSVFMAPLLSAFIIVITPLIWIFTGIKKLVVKLVGHREEEQPSVTEEELKYIIEEIEDEGVLEEQESDLVRSALEFDEITISKVLVPRINIIGIERGSSFESIKDVFIQTKFSRLPVYEGTLDSIVGVIHQSDFFELYLSGGSDIGGIMKQPVLFPEGKKISEALRELQKAKMHMGVVVDEYGGTEGICTLEDIIEELVGEIYDESDDEDTSFVKLGENRFRVSASLSVGDFLDRAGLPEDTVETDMTSVGGWVMELLGRIPEQNEFVRSGMFDMTVQMEDEQKIGSLIIKVRKQEETENA